MTLIEIVVALPIVLVSLGMLVLMLNEGGGLRDGALEEWAASTAAQNVLEEMRNEDFRDLFRLYNADPFDDPTGPGTSPGHRFAVRGLVPVEETVGEVLLPTWNSGTEVVPVWEVREDVERPELGMPRDLDGDMIVSPDDVVDDYAILPVTVRLRWRGRNGQRELRLHTVLSELR